MLEELLHRLYDAERDFVFIGSVLVDRGRVREKGRPPADPPPRIRGTRIQACGAPERDQSLRSPLHEVSDDPQASVAGDDEIVGVIPDAALESFDEVRV